MFGGLDLGSPLGGPFLGRAALGVAYFLAPLIMTTAVVEESLRKTEIESVFLLAAKEEVVNFCAAMLLRGRSVEPRVFARCFHWTRFAQSLADRLSFELLAFGDVLREALREHFEGFRTV